MAAHNVMEFRTERNCGYAVKYSPFFDSRIALATAENYGLVGNGKLYVCALGPNGITSETTFRTQDALYDVAWSETNENQLVVGSGDGSVKLYDINVAEYPVMQWQEHRREVFSVSWNLITKDTFASSSWDGTIKIWSPDRQTSILTLPTHSCAYSTQYSPHSPSVISCVSADSHLRVFDLRTPASASNHLVHLIPVHGPSPQMGRPANQETLPPSECLTHDWNKYRNTVIATGSVDSNIRTIDIRSPRAGPVALLRGHEYAVRKVAWSPHLSDVLLSASYDMSIKVWSDGTVNGQPGPIGPRQTGEMPYHTEFCTGVDWCLFGSEGWVASTSWDKRLLVWDIRNFMH